MTSPPECLRCGLCCFSPSETYVRVTGDDWSRLGPDAERLTHWVGHRAYMRRHENHCAALELRRTPDGAPQYFCTIYERRPQTCRDLARGSPHCEAELATKTAPPAGEQSSAGQ